MRVIAVACCSFAFSVGLLKAQGGTYLVNAAGGASFTEITTAVATVPNGSVLIVRPGTYAPVVVNAKDVAILCDPAVFAGGSFMPFLEVANIAAGQRVVVRGLRQAVSSGGLWVHDAAGRVAIDGTGTIAYTGFSFFMAAQVSVRGYVVAGSAAVQDSSVVFEQCSFSGGGLRAYASAVQTVQCSFQGVTGKIVPKFGVLPGGPGVYLNNSTFRAMGRATDHIRAGDSPPGGPLVPPIAGIGSARVEPAITLYGTAPVPGSIALTRPIMPSLLTSSGPPGGSIGVTRFGASGIAFVIVGGLPGPSSYLPGLVDPAWLDLATAYVEAFGIAYNGNGFQVQKPVPPNALQLRGVELSWLAIDFDLGGGFTASNPSLSVVF